MNVRNGSMYILTPLKITLVESYVFMQICNNEYFINQSCFQMSDSYSDKFGINKK